MDRTLKILILEDLPTDAELINLELKQGEIDFLSTRVADRDGFLKALEDFRPEVILSDYNLPGFNGLEALKLAQEHCPEVPFVFVSGAIGEEVAIDTLKQGATDYVLKDHLGRLVPSVQRALREAATRRERRQAAAELRQSAEEYRLLVKSIPAVVYKGYPDWTVDFFDDKIEALAGYKKQDFDSRKMKWCDVILPEDVAGAQNAFKRGLRSDHSFVREYRIIGKKGGVHWLQDRGQIIYRPSGRVHYVSGVFFDISERKRAEQELRDSEQQLRLLTSQILTAQERERKRIAMELHDELGQSLNVLKLQARTIEKGLRADQHGLKEETGELLTYLDEVIDNVRRLSRDLSPAILEDLGLQAALKYLASSFSQHYRVNHAFEIDNLADLLAPEAQIIIYRIFQESFNNIFKHARATEVNLAIKKTGAHLSLIVEDNGVGFDVAGVLAGDANRRGMGLGSLHERARMLGGKIKIHSQEGQGTRITVDLPLDRESKEWRGC
jgi:two-component system, NarL family, sensor histidine kinase UhpB